MGRRRARFFGDTPQSSPHTPFIATEALHLQIKSASALANLRGSKPAFTPYGPLSIDDAIGGEIP
jgi:hypothetical protein